MDKNMIFWSNVFDGAQETDGFQIDNKRISFEETSMVEERFALTSVCSKALLGISKEKIKGLFIVLGTGVAAILSKYCFSGKVIYGIPVLISQLNSGLKNDYVLCRTEVKGTESFLEHIRKWGEFYKNALCHQNITGEVLVGSLGLKHYEAKPLIKTMLLMAGLHDQKVVEKLHPDSVFIFEVKKGKVEFVIRYNASIFNKGTISSIGLHLVNFYEKVSARPSMLLKEVNVLFQEELLLIDSFQGATYSLAKNENVVMRFRETVAKFGNKTALVHGNEKITYSELDKDSDCIAGFLIKFCGNPHYVGIYMKNCISNIKAIIGTLKAGAAYVPFDYNLPYDRVKSIIEDICLPVMISLEKHIPFLNKIQTECSCMRNYLCLDTDDVYVLESDNNNDLCNRKLWEFVGSRSADSIEGGGWVSSYTGENLSAVEMKEYGENVRIKLEPYLSSNKKVLEIGCASGITMFRIAPYVKSYYGTDIAQAILDKNMDYIRGNNISNITLQRLPALDIDKVSNGGFDVVILNSVIQCFNGYNYFRKVFEKVLSLVADKALIFIGDIMDADKKNALIESLRKFAIESSAKGYTTKTNWSQELFFSREFFNDLLADYAEISCVEFSGKIGTIKNELTEFRYDTILRVDKTVVAGKRKKLNKQFGYGILSTCEAFCPSVKLSDCDSAYVIYTSGTTGKPKGIEIMHGSLMRFCNWNNRFYGITEKDVTTRYARVGFDAAVWELFPFLSSGSEIHIIPEEMRLDINALNSYYEKNHVTFVFLPTQIFEQFMELENHFLRIVATGGDKLNVIRPQSYRIVNNYGPTETTIIATAFEINGNYTNIPIGHPIDNTRIHIVDLNGLPQPVGIVGEICIAGYNLAKGYINLPKMTKEKFCDGRACGEAIIYHSGDLGRWLPDGNIEYHGRMDGQIKISAFRIEMDEICNTLCEMTCISKAVVRAMANEDDSRYLCAYIVTNSETITVDEIKRYLYSKLPEYMVPAYIILMKKLPITLNGKIDYTKLPNPGKAMLEKDLLLPQNVIEKDLLKAYCKVLDTEKISVTDNFFDVGGNSIKAIKLVAELTKNYEVTINDVFSYQTIRDLAKHITVTEKNLENKFIFVRESLKIIADTDPYGINKEKYTSYLESVKSISDSISMNRKKYSSVFLTGVTGFLGIHFLKRLLVETSVNITAVVRSDSNGEALRRVLHKWAHHFGNTIPSEYLSRLKLISGDLKAENFGLSNDVYELIADEADCIVNIAANVRHYGYYNEFLGINSEIIIKLACFASKGRCKDIHHVSTIGVAEGVIPNQPFFLFTEGDGDVGQVVTNYYTKTKLLAEKYLEDARRHGINVNIYRVGNLIANSETGVFQENIGTNGFYKIIRALIYMEAIPDVSIRTLDFSFINQVADAMVRLMLSDDKGITNYHLYNPYQVSMKEMTGLLLSTGFRVDIMSAEEFLNYIYNNYNVPHIGEYVKDFILHTRLFSIPSETHFTLVCNRTCETLRKLGFLWTNPNKEIIRKMMDYCVKTGFLSYKKGE